LDGVAAEPDCSGAFAVPTGAAKLTTS